MNYKQNSKPTKKNRTKKLLMILVVILLIVAGVFFAYKHFYQKKNNTVYSPPTAEEKQSGDDIKPEVVKRQEQEDAQKKDNPELTQNNQTNSPSSSAEVIITDAAQYNNVIEVRSFVSNQYKDGTCTITLTKGSLKVSKETKAYKDATTTICTNPLIDRSEFKQAGDWQVVVKYTAGEISGESKPQTVKIE